MESAHTGDGAPPTLCALVGGAGPCRQTEVDAEQHRDEGHDRSDDEDQAGTLPGDPEPGENGPEECSEGVCDRGDSVRRCQFPAATCELGQGGEVDRP